MPCLLSSTYHIAVADFLYSLVLVPLAIVWLVIFELSLEMFLFRIIEQSPYPLVIIHLSIEIRTIIIEEHRLVIHSPSMGEVAIVEATLVFIGTVA